MRFCARKGLALISCHIVTIIWIGEKSMNENILMYLWWNADIGWILLVSDRCRDFLPSDMIVMILLGKIWYQNFRHTFGAYLVCRRFWPKLLWVPKTKWIGHFFAGSMYILWNQFLWIAIEVLSLLLAAESQAIGWTTILHTSI